MIEPNIPDLGEAFANSILRATDARTINMPHCREQLRELAIEKYDWRYIAKDIIAEYKSAQ